MERTEGVHTGEPGLVVLDVTGADEGTVRL
ncbi:DUF6207 family protein [Streptomyces sp. NPDC054840]